MSAHVPVTSAGPHNLTSTHCHTCLHEHRANAWPCPVETARHQPHCQFLTANYWRGCTCEETS